MLIWVIGNVPYFAACICSKMMKSSDCPHIFIHVLRKVTVDVNTSMICCHLKKIRTVKMRYLGSVGHANCTSVERKVKSS